MSINRKITIRTVARQTGLTQREVEQCLDLILELWKEELIAGGRIEIEKFLVLETVELDRGDNGGLLRSGTTAPRFIRRVQVRAAKSLKVAINQHTRRDTHG